MIQDQSEASITDGAISDDGQIISTYLHGIFDHPQACHHLLNWAGLETQYQYDYHELQEQGINLLADTLEKHLDISVITKLISEKNE